MAFGIYSSNHLRILGHLLKTDIINANGVKISIEQLLEKRLVLVQTRGMGTWLKYFLADECGICTNVEFPFLQHFIDAQLDEHPFLKDKKRLTLDEMRWLIFDELQKNQVRYPELMPYLYSENTPLKGFELATELATIFDQYQAYLPQEVLAWKKMKTPPHWQARLYGNVLTPFLTRNEAHDCFEKSPQLHGHICKTIVIFGMSAMTPLQMSFFKSLSTVCDVQLYFLNPSEVYWGNVRASATRFETQIASVSQRKTGDTQTIKKSQMDNPILSQCGKAGINFLNHISHGDFYFKSERGYFLSRDDSTCLRSVQSDIFMNEMGVRDVEMRDDSIRVHNCHTPRREVEVLHDEILRLIEKSQGDIQPKDILIMSPSIEKYVPYIDGVFGFGALKDHYAIADRPLKQTSMICESLILLLNLISRDFKLSEVLDLFKNGAVRLAFGVNEQQNESLRVWLESSGIRWGEDAEMHAQKTHFAFKSFSFESGLERLMMGLALHECVHENAPYDIAPMAMIDFEKAPVLGGFCLFLNLLFEFSKKIKKITYLDEFSHELLQLIDQLFIRNETTIDELLGVTKEVMNLGGSLEKIPFHLDVAKKALSDGFDCSRETGHFLSGKMTFCSMMPMRSIPMKVVVILGLNDSVFPRREKILTFNLLTSNSEFRARNHCPTQSQIDRFLFLETLLSAQEKLLLFYCGQNPQKDENIPPSVVLGEFVDYLKMRFDFNEIQHRLHAYNKRYFQGEKSLLNSYDVQAFKVCERLLENHRKTIPVYCADRVALVYEKSVPINDFIKALSHPLLFYLETKTQVLFNLFKRDTQQCDEELLNLDYLQQTMYKANLAEKIFKGSYTFEEVVHKMELENRLPVGQRGIAEVKKLYEDISHLPDLFKDAYKYQKSKSICFKIQDIELYGNVQLQGSEESLFEICFAQVKSKNVIALWIKHLLLCATNEPKKSHLAEVSYKNTSWYEFLPLPPDVAFHYLFELVELYKRSHEDLIPFFPKTSLVYAKSEKETIEERWKVALETYEGAYISKPEKEEDKVIFYTFPEEESINFLDFDKYAKILLRPFFARENDGLINIYGGQK